MDLKQQYFTIKAIIFLPPLCSSNQKNISKHLDGIQIFHGKNLEVTKLKEDKVSFSNSKMIDLSISYKI